MKSGLRYFGPVLLIALCLATLGTVTAISLFEQQSAMTQVLQENVASRRAAVELRECLTDLIALENAKVETVAVLHDRVRVLLDAVDRTADQPEERALYQQLGEAFASYLTRWQALPPPEQPDHERLRGEVTRDLEQSVLRPCEDFILYNGRRIETSAANHERVLRRLAWGMGIVGGLGAVAGVVFGFGVARGLNRSIGRLQVQIQDAAGKLGPALPEVVLRREGSFRGLHEEIDRLSRRIEGVLRTLQQRELEVLRAEQLAAVGQLAAGVGHEIRNPLTSIKLLVQAALEEDSSLATDELQIIEGEVRRMEQSLQTFLDFARPPHAEHRRFNLSAVIESVSGLLRGRAERQKVLVCIISPANELTMVADAEQIRQVLVNLGLNALDAMPTGGTLTIEARVPEPGRVAIEVRDSGSGIPPNLLPRLFEPFISGKDTGLGLGLAISQRIVEGHGGTIRAVNRSEGGACFTITLPTEASHAVASGD